MSQLMFGSTNHGRLSLDSVIPEQDPYAGRTYYEDQRSWSPTDFQGLWRRFNRILQSIPTPLQGRVDFLDVAAARGPAGQLSAEITLWRLGK